MKDFSILIVLLIVGFFAVSWCTNVIKFANADFEEPYTTEIIRGIGIPCAPLGAIIGFMDIGEEN